MIVIAIPSRGLMHSRTMDDVLKNTKDFEVEFIFSHGRAQPDAQNYITEEALKLKPEYILYFDDDVALFSNKIVYELLAALRSNPDRKVAVADYPCTKHGSSVVHIRNGKFESAGMGIVLVRPEVFDKLERPFFRCDTQYTWDGEQLEANPVPPNHEPGMVHGLHDVDWFQRLLKVGVEPVIINSKCGQYNLIDNNIKKYGNMTFQNIETWRFPK